MRRKAVRPQEVLWERSGTRNAEAFSPMAGLTCVSTAVQEYSIIIMLVWAAEEWIVPQKA